MALMILVCGLMVTLTTLVHYEALRMIGAGLPRLDIRPRTKLIVVMMSTFIAHLLEVTLYALTIYALVHGLSVGAIGDQGPPTWFQVLYFSAETYTSLGYGDVVPHGPLRLLAGVEALNGLLLIGWSASFAYVAMERFWKVEPGRPG